MPAVWVLVCRYHPALDQLVYPPAIDPQHANEPRDGPLPINLVLLAKRCPYGNNLVLPAQLANRVGTQLGDARTAKAFLRQPLGDPPIVVAHAT